MDAEVARELPKEEQERFVPQLAREVLAEVGRIQAECEQAVREEDPIGVSAHENALRKVVERFQPDSGHRGTKIPEPTLAFSNPTSQKAH